MPGKCAQFTLPIPYNRICYIKVMLYIGLKLQIAIFCTIKIIIYLFIWIVIVNFAAIK